MNEISNRYRNIIAAIDNLLVQLDYPEDENWISNDLKNLRIIYSAEMEYHKTKEDLYAMRFGL